MTGDSKQGTVDGLLAFTKYVVDKNYAPHTAIRPLESAITAVFESVYGKDEAGAVNVLNLDFEELGTRFANATGSKYKAESRSVYMQRVKKAIRVYEEHLDNPDRPPNLTTRKARQPRSVVTNGSGNGNAETAKPAVPKPSADVRTYTFPLQNGDAQLSIPREFYSSDAERLTSFIGTLVFEPRRQIEATSSFAEED